MLGKSKRPPHFVCLFVKFVLPSYLYLECSGLCDSLHLSVLFHVINLLTIPMAKQKVRKCLTPFFYAETIKAVLIPFNTPHTIFGLEIMDGKK